MRQTISLLMIWAERFNKTYYLETKIPKEKILNALEQKIIEARQNKKKLVLFKSSGFEEMSIYRDVILVNDIYKSGKLLEGSLVIKIVDCENITQIYAKTKLRFESIFIPAIGILIGALVGFILCKWPSLTYDFVIPDFFVISALILMTIFSLVIIPISIIHTNKSLKNYIERIFWNLGIYQKFEEFPK